MGNSPSTGHGSEEAHVAKMEDRKTGERPTEEHSKMSTETESDSNEDPKQNPPQWHPTCGAQREGTEESKHGVATKKDNGSKATDRTKCNEVPTSEKRDAEERQPTPMVRRRGLWDENERVSYSYGGDRRMEDGNPPESGYRSGYNREEEYAKSRWAQSENSSVNRGRTFVGEEERERSTVAQDKNSLDGLNGTDI